MKGIETNRYPFATCPRQIAFPERKNCYSQEQFFDWFNRLNGIKRKLYYSVYTTDDNGTFENVIVDSIPFDLDSENCLANIRKFRDYCAQHDYKCLFVFSTKGFWVFVKTTGVKLNNPKTALGDAQRKIAQDIGLTIGQSKEADIDQAIIGDIARITRAINSKDVGRGRFCINLKIDELDLSYDDIVAISKQPRFTYYIYGTKPFDLTAFDTKESKYSPSVNGNKTAVPLDKETATIQMDVDINTFLPCVQTWLTRPEKGIFTARYYYAVFCAQTGITPQKCDEIANKYFGNAPRTDGLRNNYNHFRKDQVIKKAYREDKIFPSCDTLIQKGLCPGVCKKYAGKNSPIYYNGE